MELVSGLTWCRVGSLGYLVSMDFHLLGLLHISSPQMRGALDDKTINLPSSSIF